MHEKIIVAFILSLFTTDLCRGQSFTTINYSIPEGFPSAEVYEVFQDKRKFLWFATDNGVVRFDGYDLQKFNIDRGLSDPVVFGFHEDRQGNIWFRTFSGRLSYFDYEKGKIIKYRYNDKLASLCQNSFLWTIHVDSLKQLWFGTFGVWGKIDSAGNVSQTKLSGGCSVYYQSVENNFLWGRSASLAGNHCVMINGAAYAFKPVFFPNSVPTLCATRWRNKFYFSFNFDLFELDGKKMRTVPLTGERRSIINLSLDRDDNLWIGRLGGGLERYSTPDFKNLMEFSFFKDKSVTEVMQDHEHGLWITTLEKGVFYIPNFNIRNQYLPAASDIISASTFRNQILIGLRHGEIMTIDKSTHQVTKQKSMGSPINSHYVDKQKNVWVSTDSGTVLLDSSWRKKDVLRTTFHNYYEDQDGKIWFVGKSTLHVYNNMPKKLFSVKLDSYYRTMVSDDSLIFLTSRTGIHVYSGEFKKLKDLPSLADYKFSTVLHINDSLLLLTSIQNGFFLLNKRTWDYVHYNSKNKFIANDIFTAIVADSSVWMATEKGIIRVSVPSLLRQDPTFEILNQKSGLMGDKANFLVEVDDYIWAFYDRGYSAFPKNISISSGREAIFYIKGISVNNRPLLQKDNNELKHTENNLTLDFGFIAFVNQNIFVRYRLKKDILWSYTTERSLNFYSLSPGTYEVEIDYSLDNTHWSRALESPQFTILPPWWQTWYFQTGVFLMVLLIVFLYFKNQVNIYRRYQRKLIQSEMDAIENERGRIAKELHDSVGTDLTAIKMVVSQRLKKSNDPKTDEVESQLQNTIQDIKSIIYGLSPPGLERYGLMAGLKNYINKLNDTISIKIELNAFGPEVKDPKLNIAVFRILQELISNSLKHSKADTISIHVNSFRDLLNIVYEDNGQGFTWEENHKGLGLYNIQLRIQSLQGKLKFDSGSFGISYTLDIPVVAKDE